MLLVTEITEITEIDKIDKIGTYATKDRIAVIDKNDRLG
jgi:hypothetical protein